MENWKRFKNLDEATRRDILRGGGAALATAALGGSMLLGDEEEERGSYSSRSGFKSNKDEDGVADILPNVRNPQSDKPFQKSGGNIELDYVKPRDIGKMREEAKRALNDLMFVPDLPYYQIAPAGGMGQKYAMAPVEYVDVNMADDPSLQDKIDAAREFYYDWSLSEMTRFVWGSQAFWGTYKSNDASSRKVMQTIKSKDAWGGDMNVNLLPVAWQVSANEWLYRIENVMSAIQGVSEDQKRRILASEGLSEEEFMKIAADYEKVIQSLQIDPLYVQNEGG